MHSQVYPNAKQAPIAKRVERLEKLSHDLVERFGENHQLSRRVAQQLKRAQAEASERQVVNS